MKKILALLFLILCFQIKNSEAQGFLFSQFYGTSCGFLSSISETTDGNLIACGNFSPTNMFEIGMLLKLDLNGNIIWQKIFNLFIH